MPSKPSRPVTVVLAFVAAAQIGAGPAFATSFTISTASTTAQTLGSGSGQTGTVTDTGSLTVSGATVAVTVSGNNATLTNLGTISQTGTGRVIRDNTGVSGLLINNGSLTNSTALMQAADADVIQMNKSPASVTLNNYGTITSLNASKGGAQAVDFNAILSGTNIINNFSTGVMQAQDADAVRPGVNGVVYNAGKIIATNTTDTGDDGVDAQTNTGVQITNDVNASITGARHGITGGNTTLPGTFTMSVTNNSGATIQGNNGSGINIDGLNGNELVTILNNGKIVGNGVTGDGDGVDVDGLVNLTNTGTIRSLNAFSSTSPAAQSEGVTVGGGTIVNSGTIEGLVAAGNTNAVGRGITLAGVDTSGSPEAIYGNTVVTNQANGLINGQSDSGIVVQGPASGFTVVINNNAGATIMGGGTTNAAVQTGADNDTINNAGLIKATGGGKAIDMGAGKNALNITGGAASIVGDISGGSGSSNVMTIDPGKGNTFSYSGSISNFSSVETKSGTVTLSGVNTYTGTTRVSGGTLIVGATGGAQALGDTMSVSLSGGGTLKLGASDQINNLAAMSLDGGIFDLNNFSEGSAGVDGLGSLLLFSTSTLDFGDLGHGANDVEFGGFTDEVAGPVLLQVTDFDFYLDHLFFGSGSAGTSGIFDANPFSNLKLCFDGLCGAYNVFSFTSASGSTYFEVAPVPEPTTLVLLGLGLGGFGISRRKRRAQ